MCSARVRSDDDLTTRARIREAAVDLFGRAGFAATSVRAIATEVGVSPALLLHHFGSKDGLRQACDDHITGWLTDEIERVNVDDTPATVMSLMGRRPEYNTMIRYVRRTIVDGGKFADRVFASLVTDTRRYLAAEVAHGHAPPTDDEEGRALTLVVLSLGTHLLAQYLAPPGTADDDVIFVAGERLALPMLEMLTHGLYSDTLMLDAYREYLARIPHLTSEKGSR